eukprot:2921734-Ditylum_brightwellii.AAC.1
MWIPPKDSSSGKEDDDLLYLVDGTVGSGGHSLAALQSSPSIQLLAMDVDESSLSTSQSRLCNAIQDERNRVSYWHGSYATITEALQQSNFPSKVDGILIDLGFGSAQMDDPNR